jgi:hypothetical protein
MGTTHISQSEVTKMHKRTVGNCAIVKITIPFAKNLGRHSVQIRLSSHHNIVPTGSSTGKAPSVACASICAAYRKVGRPRAPEPKAPDAVVRRKPRELSLSTRRIQLSPSRPRRSPLSGSMCARRPISRSPQYCKSQPHRLVNRTRRERNG